MSELTCFKAYDVRGKLGEQINEDIVYQIGRAFAQYLDASCIVIGHDARLSSTTLKKALAQGIMDAGSDVIDIGMTGTEEVYFSSFFLDVDGGIEVTASHNPIDYNGLKFIGRGGVPITEQALKKIKALAENQAVTTSAHPGTLKQLNILKSYVDHLLNFINLDHLKPLKLVVNAGNGAAGHVIDAIEEQFNDKNIPIKFIKIHHEPDGHFPHGIPNPLLPENRHATSEAVIKHNADMGIAWDGDFDRCFFFDEKGQFIEGYYIVGMLAKAFLKKYPNENIVHDPRLTWNTIDIVEKNGGTPIQSKTGHAFMKETMRKTNAIYGGEMSAHHYFRDFAYCDSGMIPWLLVMELISINNKTLSELMNHPIVAYPCSGEMNYRVANMDSIFNKVLNFYSANSLMVDNTDGVSMIFPDWRFNLRGSNTEALLRLNVEAKENPMLVECHVKEIERLIIC